MSGDDITLTAGGLIYAGWTSINISRHIERLAGAFALEVSERWIGQAQPWQIPPMTPVALKIGSDLVLTGYTDDYNADLDATNHKVQIPGRSKTMDLVDCMPPIVGGQFNDYSLDAIARAIVQFFGLSVTFSADVTRSFPAATYEITETAFAYLDRLCALSGVLALDDANGNLVIAQAGTASAAGALVEGENGVKFSLRMSGRQRFSQYVVVAQAGLAFDGVASQADVIGEFSDPSVKRFRRFAEQAENAADPGMAAARAKWRAQRNGGRSVKLIATVPGWRQTTAANAPLWQVNQIVPAKAPSLHLNRPLLSAGVTFILDDQGERTEIELMPQEAYSPDPASVKFNPTLSGAFWNSAVPIGP
jgi:prophage tail gpP-like protein